MSQSSSQKYRNVRPAAENRWCWITAWTITHLDALLQEIQLPPEPDLSITRAVLQYSAVVKHRLSSRRRRHRESASAAVATSDAPIQPWEVEHLFVLEAELWGADSNLYRRLLPFESLPKVLPEYFGFPTFFYLIERTMNLFGGDKRYTTGRPKFRNQVVVPHVLPYFSILGTVFDLCIRKERPTIFTHSKSDDGYESLPESSPFFRSLIYGLSHRSGSEVLERSLRQLRLSKSEENMYKKADHFNWYDALLRYSEQIRYHPLHSMDLPGGAIFYGNLAVRWLGSLLLTAFLRILQDNGVAVAELWEAFARRAPWIYELLGGEGRFG